MDDKNSTRARNRTVMLTSDLAGQVRSQFTTLPSSSAEHDESMEKGFEPPEVTNTNSTEESESPFNQLAQQNDWVTPSHASIPPEPHQSNAAAWSNGNTYDEPEEPEENVKKAPNYKRKKEEIGYRSTSRSELEEIVWQTLTPLAGFLVSFDKNPLGDYVELRTGRLIVTSEREGSGNYLFIDDPSVSAMHAIMRVSVDGPTQILDQLSDNATKIIRAITGEEEILSGEKSIVNHGDSLIFGERRYQICLLIGTPNAKF